MPSPPPLPHEVQEKPSPWLLIGIVSAIVVGVAVMVMGSAFAVRKAQPHLLAIRLMEHSDAGRYEEGLALAEKELPGVTPNAAVYYAMENLHFGANNLEETEYYALKTLELDPANEMAIKFLLVIMRDFDRNEEGLQHGRDWIAKNNTGIDVYRHLAMLADDTGDQEAAYAYAREGHRRDPARVRLASVYFYYLMQIKGVEVAQPTIDAWLEKHTPDEYFYAQLGKGLSEAGASAKAVEVLEKALAMGSTDDGVFSELVDSFRQLGDWERAEALADRYPEIFAKDPDLLRVMGALEYDVEDYELALDYFRRSRVLDPIAPVSTSNIMYTLCELGKSEEALAEGRAWLEKGGVTPTTSIYRGMAHAYASLGIWESALEEYHRALELEPSASTSARDVIICLTNLDRQEEAVAFGEGWQEQNPDVIDGSFDDALDLARANESED